MNKEKIIEALKPHDKEFAKAGIKEYSLVLSVKEQKTLLDYITNLQEENYMYKNSFETMSKNYFEEKVIIDKAIEYIGSHFKEMVADEEAQVLLNILKGDNK